jgi:hypothetical protein
MNHATDRTMPILPASRTLARMLIVAMLASALSACSSDNNGSTGPGNVDGTYNLSTIDGSTLPYLVPDPMFIQNIYNSGAATFTTSASHTVHDYTITSIVVTGGDAPASIVLDVGSFVLSGASITFTSAKFETTTYTGTATSTELTANVPGAMVGSSDSSFSLTFTKAP